MYNVSMVMQLREWLKPILFFFFLCHKHDLSLSILHDDNHSATFQIIETNTNFLLSLLNLRVKEEEFF